MPTPVWVMVGVRLVTFVPYGTVTAIVPVFSLVVLIVPATPARTKDVISFLGLGSTVTVTVYVLALLSAAVTV